MSYQGRPKRSATREELLRPSSIVRECVVYARSLYLLIYTRTLGKDNIRIHTIS